MIKVQNKKKKAHPNPLQMSIKQNPLQLILSGQEKNIQISFNPKASKKLPSPKHQEIWIPPPAKSTRRIRNCCSYKYPTDEITLSLSDDGKFILQDGLPLVIESDYPGNFKAAIYPSRPGNVLIFPEKNSASSVDQYKQRIKESFEKQYTVLKESEKMLREQETKKNILTKYVNSLKRNMEQIRQSITEIERLDADEDSRTLDSGKHGSRVSSESKSLTSNSSIAEEIVERTPPKQKKDPVYIKPTEIHIPADKLKSNRENKQKYLDQIDNSGIQVLEGNAVCKDAMIKLADTMRKSKLLLDNALQQEQSVSSLQKKYIQGVEELYGDQQNLLKVICHTLDECSSNDLLDNNVCDSDLETKIVDEDFDIDKSKYPDNNYNDIVPLLDTESSKFKLNSEPNLSHHKRTQSLSEKLALANLQLEKLQKELELAKTSNLSSQINQNTMNKENTEKSSESSKCNASQQLVGSTAHNNNQSENTNCENSFQKTVTQKVKSSLSDSLIEKEPSMPDKEPVASLTGTVKAINQLKQTLDGMIPKVENAKKNNPSDIHVQHQEHNFERQTESIDKKAHEDKAHTKADTDIPLSSTVKEHKGTPTINKRNVEVSDTHATDKEIQRKNNIHVPTTNYKGGKVSGPREKDKSPIPLKSCKQAGSHRDKEKHMKKDTSMDNNSIVSLSYKGSSGFDIGDSLKFYDKHPVSKEGAISTQTDDKIEQGKQRTRSIENEMGLNKQLSSDEPSFENVMESTRLSESSKYKQSSKYSKKKRNNEAECLEEGFIASTTPKLPSYYSNDHKYKGSLQNGLIEGPLPQIPSGYSGNNEDDSSRSMVEGTISHPSQYYVSSGSSRNEGRKLERSLSEPASKLPDNRKTISNGIDNLIQEPKSQVPKGYSENYEDNSSHSLVEGTISHPSQYYISSEPSNNEGSKESSLKGGTEYKLPLNHKESSNVTGENAVYMPSSDSNQFYELTPLSYSVSTQGSSYYKDMSAKNTSKLPASPSKNHPHRPENSYIAHSGSDQFYPLTPLSYNVSSPELTSKIEEELREGSISQRLSHQHDAPEWHKINENVQLQRSDSNHLYHPNDGSKIRISDHRKFSDGLIKRTITGSSSNNKKKSEEKKYKKVENHQMSSNLRQNQRQLQSPEYNGLRRLTYSYQSGSKSKHLSPDQSRISSNEIQYPFIFQEQPHLNEMTEEEQNHSISNYPMHSSNRDSGSVSSNTKQNSDSKTSKFNQNQLTLGYRTDQYEPIYFRKESFAPRNSNQLSSLSTEQQFSSKERAFYENEGMPSRRMFHHQSLKSDRTPPSFQKGYSRRCSTYAAPISKSAEENGSISNISPVRRKVSDDSGSENSYTGNLESGFLSEDDLPSEHSYQSSLPGANFSRSSECHDQSQRHNEEINSQNIRYSSPSITESPDNQRERHTRKYSNALSYNYTTGIDTEKKSFNYSPSQDSKTSDGQWTNYKSTLNNMRRSMHSGHSSQSGSSSRGSSMHGQSFKISRRTALPKNIRSLRTGLQLKKDLKNISEQDLKQYKINELYNEIMK